MVQEGAVLPQKKGVPRSVCALLLTLFYCEVEKPLNVRGSTLWFSALLWLFVREDNFAPLHVLAGVVCMRDSL